MGNFEKLGILVIIMLVVVILVLTVWGVGQDELGAVLTPQQLESRGENGQGSNESVPANPVEGHVPPAPPGPPAPSPWPAPEPDDNDLPAPSPQPVPAPVPAPSDDLNYVVRDGDSLYRIAEHYYHDGNKFQVIQDANPTVDANVMKVGTTLVIPHPSRVLVDAPTPAPSPAPAPSGNSYLVKDGDSLWRIAEKTLGRGSEFQKILDANRDILSGNGDDLQPGMTLRIPR